MYKASDVRVIGSTNIGEGYAALTMMDTTVGDTDVIAGELELAMEGVLTAEISRCVRKASFDGVEVHKEDYIGFVGKKLLAVNESRFTTICETIDKMDLASHEVCIVFCGNDATKEETEQIQQYLSSNYRGKEVYFINSGQKIYDYIVVVE